MIGNKKGGIVDYVVDGSTGWVNKTATAEELASKMEYIIRNPGEIRDLNRKIIKDNKGLIKSMDTHLMIKDIYLNLVN